MANVISLFTKIIKKFQERPETLQFLVNKNQEVSSMITEIYDRYMNLPKFSELIKDDPRKYKTYYVSGYSSSTSGIIRILKKYKFYNVRKNWNIYISEGYNRIELELNELKPTNPEQIIFGIQGCDNLVGKTSLWNILEKKYGRDKAKELLPETFVLSNDKHIELFKEQYVENELYILKSKKQKKEGIKLTRDINEILEANEKNFTLVQDYKKDLLLINNRKLNIRMYLLLTLKDGILKAYINKHATCIYCNKNYDDSTNDFESNITSYNLDIKIYDKNPLTMRQLRTYLIDNGYENPDILFKRIDEKVALVVDAVKPHFGKKGNLTNNLCLQIFGMDFLVDKNLNPFLLECNKGPDMTPKYNEDFSKLIRNIEDFYNAEELIEKCYPVGYKSGNGLKVQRDIFKLLKLIDFDSYDNGFYELPLH